MQRHRTARFLSIPSSTSGFRRVSSDVSCTRGGVCVGLGLGLGEGGMECAFEFSLAPHTPCSPEPPCVSVVLTPKGQVTVKWSGEGGREVPPRVGHGGRIGRQNAS